MPRTHWATPSTITGFFLLGFGFGVGHHLWYSFLDEQIVDRARWPQSYNLNIGTVFMNAARASLVTSVAAAFWQVFWSRLHGQSITLGDIDKLHGLPGSPLALIMSFYQFYVHRLYRFWPLPLLALFLLVLPFLLISTQSALSVTTRNRTVLENHDLKTPSFLYHDYGLWPDDTYYAGPDRWLQRIILGATYAGHLPLIPAVASNSTYSLSFAGPGIKCSSRDASEYVETLRMAAGGCQNQLDSCGDTAISYRYLSWVPDPTRELPFAPNSITGMLPGLPVTLGAVDHQSPSVYVATLPNPTADWQVMCCSLHNVSYEYIFTFENGNQTVNITSVEDLGPVVTDSLAGEDKASSFWGYAGLFDILGNILVGTIWSQSSENSSAKVYHVSGVKFLETDMTSTIEMAPIVKDIIPGVGVSEYLPPLNRTLEDLMAYSMIPALFSEDYFLNKIPVNTTVTRNLYSNEYTYDRAQLMSWYGAALTVAFISVGLGIFFLWRDGASYSNLFSTIVRTTRSVELDQAIEVRYRKGEDSLPPELCTLNIQFDRSWGSVGGTDGGFENIPLTNPQHVGAIAGAGPFTQVQQDDRQE